MEVNAVQTPIQPVANTGTGDILNKGITLKQILIIGGAGLLLYMFWKNHKDKTDAKINALQSETSITKLKNMNLEDDELKKIQVNLHNYLIEHNIAQNDVHAIKIVKMLTNV